MSPPRKYVTGKLDEIILLLRVKECKITDSNGSEVYPIHSFKPEGTCFDQRLAVNQTSNSPNIEIEFRSFRFTVNGRLGDSDRMII